MQAKTCLNELQKINLCINIMFYLGVYHHLDLERHWELPYILFVDIGMIGISCAIICCIIVYQVVQILKFAFHYKLLFCLVTF